MNYPQHITGTLDANGADYRLNWRTGDLTIMWAEDLPDNPTDEQARAVLDDIARIRREHEAKGEHIPPLTQGIAALSRRIECHDFATEPPTADELADD